MNINTYKELGWAFIPIEKWGKRPLGSWKKHQKTPLSKEESDDYIDKILMEDLNLGIVTGQVSDLTVVDFDFKDGGGDTLNKLLDTGIIDDTNPMVNTPHGKHIYFKHQEGLTNAVGILKGVDIRNDGGYVVAPPSNLRDGVYSWDYDGNDEVVVPIVKSMPLDLFNLLKGERQESSISSVQVDPVNKNYADLISNGVSQGQRNGTAVSLAGYFISKGLSKDVTISLLNEWNTKNKPPLKQSEIVVAVENINKREQDKTEILGANVKPVFENFEVPDIPIISEYVRLAGSAIPAPDSYHVLCCLSMLSTLLSENVSLNLKSDILYPNLYTMLLADTTWTYKTTSMKRALKFLDKVYPDSVIGSGGSPEGLFYTLSERPGISSLFFRDEAVGFFYEAGAKSYMTGMLDSLTKYYDCQSERRVLAGGQGDSGAARSVTIRDPRLNLMAGGTLTRFFDVVSDTMIMDGFLPRFLFSVREGSASNLKPLELAGGDYNRDNDVLLQEIMGLYLFGRRELTTDQAVLNHHHEYMVSLVTSKFSRFGGQDFGGVFNRLAINVLKVATIIACLEGGKSDRVRLTLSQLDKAIMLSQEWKQSIDYIIQKIGKPAKERLYDKIVRQIYDNGRRVTQADLMNMFHLESRDIERIITTLIDREIIERQGKWVILK